MAEQFLIWSSEYEEGWCVIRGPEGIKKAHQLSSGTRRRGLAHQGDLPHEQRVSEYIELTDNLYGTVLAVIRTGENVLADAKATGVEYLPVQIYNHKNKVASADMPS